MGSVLDYIECPNCRHQAFSDFYYKTGEEYINCQNCGYHYSATYKKDEEGKYVTRDGTENYVLDNLILEEKEIKNPYGAYKLRQYGSPAYECGSLEEESDFIALTANIKKYDNVDTCRVSRFVDGEIKVEYIIGTPTEVTSSPEEQDKGEII